MRPPRTRLMWRRSDGTTGGLDLAAPIGTGTATAAVVMTWRAGPGHGAIGGRPHRLPAAAPRGGRHGDPTPTPITLPFWLLAVAP